jgi:hypothetical protein
MSQKIREGENAKAQETEIHEGLQPAARVPAGDSEPPVRRRDHADCTKQECHGNAQYACHRRHWPKIRKNCGFDPATQSFREIHLLSPVKRSL